MRLLLLRDHQELLGAFLAMYTECLAEAGDEKKTALSLMQERLLDSNRQVFLFKKGPAVIGFAEVVIEERCFPDEDLPELSARVVSFYIAPHERGQKLGSAFFKLIRDWARDQKAAMIEAEAPSALLSLQQFFAYQGLELVDTGVRNCYRAFV